MTNDELPLTAEELYRLQDEFSDAERPDVLNALAQARTALRLEKQLSQSGRALSEARAALEEARARNAQLERWVRDEPGGEALLAAERGRRDAEGERDAARALLDADTERMAAQIDAGLSERVAKQTIEIHELKERLARVGTLGDMAVLRARREEREALLAPLKQARAAIDRDRTGLATGLNEVRGILGGYRWLADGGWGSYDYTQQTEAMLRQEFGWCLEAAAKKIEEALHASGDLANAAVRDIDDAIRAPTTREQAAAPEEKK